MSYSYRQPGESYLHAHDADVHALQQRAHRHAQAHAQAHARRRAQVQAAASDYTFVHGKRRVRIGPVAFWICVGSLIVMAGWTMVTATYFAFRDDVLTRLIARQAEMQHAYEDRIADMRGQIDRVMSRQLLDQEQFEQKLDQISRRQAQLEQRAAALNNFVDPTPTGSVKPAAHGKPTLLDGERSSRLERGLAAIAARFTGKQSGGLSGTITRMEESLNKVETRQIAALASIEENFSAKARRMRSVLIELGVEAGRPIPEAQGGPFVPVKAHSDTQAFERYLQRINVARGHVERFNRTLGSVPVRKPVPELDQSSGFGVRPDPFLGRPAMHTGLDFRGGTGDPVRATAAGRVDTAGWNGGYGKLVEIDHGNGLSTRYGHLSEILVRAGQHVKIGQIIGRIGSTGRSTGPHLHYETRRNGDAVDPTRFLRAGAKLGLAH